MIAADPMKLEAPRRARQSWEQVETIAAQAVLGTMRAVAAAHRVHQGGTASPLLDAELMEAVLAGATRAYALTVTELGIVDDLVFQERVMRRGIAKAGESFLDGGREEQALEGVLLEEFRR